MGRPIILGADQKAWVDRMMTGIYAIENMVNGKIYIGQAVGIQKRNNDERARLNSKTKPWNNHLQSAWNKYGKENFEFVVIEIPFIEYNPFTDLSFNEQTGYALTIREQYWMDTLRAAGYILYNQKDASYVPINRPSPNDKAKFGRPGRKVSAETRAKQSAALKGRVFSAETRAKMSAAQKGEKSSCWGKKISEETRAKLSGKKISEETRAKLSASKKGKNHPFYGKNLTEEHKRRLSEAGKTFQKNLTEEQKSKISEATSGSKNHFYGKHHSDETKAKLRALNVGKKVSLETRAKLSAAAKKKNE